MGQDIVLKGVICHFILLSSSGMGDFPGFQDSHISKILFNK